MEEIIKDIRESKNRVYKELINKFGNIYDQEPKVTFEILSYCKRMSDDAMLDYKNNDNIESGYKIVAITDICRTLCGD